MILYCRLLRVYAPYKYTPLGFQIPNKNGTPTCNEAFLLFCQYYMNDLFNAVDSNRDGIIDFDEFVHFYDIHEFNTSTTDRERLKNVLAFALDLHLMLSVK